MFMTLRRLQSKDAAAWRRDEQFDHSQNSLTDIVEKASRQVVECAQQFENPVIVLEDLSYIRERLDYGKFMRGRSPDYRVESRTKRPRQGFPSSTSTRRTPRRRATLAVVSVGGVNKRSLCVRTTTTTYRSSKQI
jgi:transposase